MRSNIKLSLDCKLYFLIILILGCQEVDISNKYTFELRSNNFEKENLKVDYYPDSSIKEAYKVDSLGQKRGKIFEFSKSGIIERIYFLNNSGELVGDESIFNDLGFLTDHFFRLDSNSLLFYAKFTEKGKLLKTKGEPFLISYTDKIRVGDTASFYIATPIIPGFRTDVTFQQDRVPSSKVSYTNDLRQYTYRKVMSDTGQFLFLLNIRIEDSLNKQVINGRDSFTLKVRNISTLPHD